MTHYRDWGKAPHVPLHGAETCGHRGPAGHHCNRAAGHEGRHKWAWQRISPGRVRAVWD